MDDLISKQAAIDAILREVNKEERPIAETRWFYLDIERASEILKGVPPAEPFHITTLDEVLEFIDGMPEDVWLEFTECLACRG